MDTISKIQPAEMAQIQMVYTTVQAAVCNGPNDSGLEALRFLTTHACHAPMRWIKKALRDFDREDLFASIRHKTDALYKCIIIKTYRQMKKEQRSHYSWKISALDILGQMAVRYHYDMPVELMDNLTRLLLLEERNLYQQSKWADHPQPCPRCGGKMNTNLQHNALSRHATIHICEMCGAEEALRDWQKNILPLSDWAMFKMMDVELTEQQVYAEDLTISDDQKSIEAYIPIWFDAGKKFCVDTDDDDGWISFFAVYTPATKKLTMFFVLDFDDLSWSFTYIPTNGEKKLVVEAMEKAAQRENHCTLAEYIK